MAYSIIFDTETTGLNEEDRIIQIGAIIIDENGNYYKQGVYNELCSSDIPIKLGAMSVHQIREEYLINKPKFEETEFYKALLELNSESNYLIAHNLPFDLGMLEKYNFKSNYQHIDTLQSSKHLFETSDNEEAMADKENRLVPNFKLQTFRFKLFRNIDEENELKKYDGIEIKAHDAIGDVIILKLFVDKLYEFIKIKYPSTDRKSFLDTLVKLTNKTVKLKIMSFGKYKGKSFTEIQQSDPGYINWLKREQEKKGADADKNLVEALNTL